MAAAVVATMMLSLLAGHAHRGDTVYLIYKLAPGAIGLQDGHLLDWEDMVPGASLFPANFDEVIRGQAGVMTNPVELAFRVFLEWVQEEQRVYVGVEIFDDIYHNEWDGMAIRDSYLADHVIFYVDGDHSGGEYSYSGYTVEAATDEQKRFANSTAQQYVAVSEAPTGRLVRNWGPAGPWVASPPRTDGGGATLDRSQGLSVVELAVTPWDDLDWHGHPDGRGALRRLRLSHI